jgi:hypothetical protein
MHAKGVLAQNIARLNQEISEATNRLNDLQGTPPSASDMYAASDIQARYDPYYRELEMGGAPGILNGERPTSFRRRLLSTLQPLSKTWREANLHNTNISENVVDAAEQKIFADVTEVTHNNNQGSFKNPGALRVIERTSEAGARIREYRGDPINWMKSFMIPAGVGRINDKLPRPR